MNSPTAWVFIDCSKKSVREKFLWSGSNPRNACARCAPAPMLLHENAHHAVLATVVGFTLRASNRGCVRQHGNIRGCVPHLNIAGLDGDVTELGILDHVDLLLFADENSPGVDFHKV